MQEAPRRLLAGQTFITSIHNSLTVEDPLWPLGKRFLRVDMIDENARSYRQDVKTSRLTLEDSASREVKRAIY